MNTGLPVVILLAALGLAIFSHLQPGWAARLFLALRISWRSFLHGETLCDIPHTAWEQSDVQWGASRTVIRRQAGWEPWEWDENFETVWPERHRSERSRS
jgi:hypothetical protein